MSQLPEEKSRNNLPSGTFSGGFTSNSDVLFFFARYFAASLQLVVWEKFYSKIAVLVNEGIFTLKDPGPTKYS